MDLLGTVEGADGGNGDGLLEMIDADVREVSKRPRHGMVCIIHQHLHET